MKIEEKIEKYLNTKVDYMNEDSALQDIKELCEKFDIDYDIAEEIYLEETTNLPSKQGDNKIVGLSTAGKIAGIGVGASLWAIWRAIGSWLDKSKRKCGTFSISKKRDICILNARIESINKKIEIVKKAEVECLKNYTSQNKIESCKYNADKYRDELSSKLRDLEYELQKIKRG